MPLRLSTRPAPRRESSRADFENVSTWSATDKTRRSEREFHFTVADSRMESDRRDQLPQLGRVITCIHLWSHREDRPVAIEYVCGAHGPDEAPAIHRFGDE